MKMIFKGFKQVGPDYSDFEDGYIYLIRTDEKGEIGCLRFDGRYYGDITKQSIKDMGFAELSEVPQGTVTSVSGASGITGTVTESGTLSLSSEMTGSTTVSSISNIPVNNKLVLANISANAMLSFSSLPQNGFDVQVIIHNTGSNVITVTLPNSGNYICTYSDTIYIAGGEYGEVNIASIGGRGYIRGVNSI